MHHNKIIKQLKEVSELSFSNAFDVMALLQDQTGRVATAMLDQSGWLSNGSREAVHTYAEAFKGGRQSFKKFVDAGYQQLDKFIPI
jgi:hypothetical protein